MAIALKALSVLMGLVAAVLWFMSASGKIPPAPGASFGGTSLTDPFNVALRQSALLNQWAAGATGLSVFFMVSAECVTHVTRRRRKRPYGKPRLGA